MPLLINDADPAKQRVTGIPMSAPVAKILRCDALGWADAAESFSMVIPVLIQERGDKAFQKVVIEASSGGRIVYALVYESDGVSSWRFSWRIGDGSMQVRGPDIGFDPNGRVCAVALSYQRRNAGAAASTLRLCVFTPGMAATGFAEARVGAVELSGLPASWGLGRSYANVPVAEANMRGLALLWVLRASAMNGELVADGRTLDDGVASVNVRNLIFPKPDMTDFCGAAGRYPGALVFALNHSCSGRLWNGYFDCRPGKSTSACAAFDLHAASFPGRWNRTGGGSFVGPMLHVNPYQEAGAPWLPPPINYELGVGVTAPFTNVGPIGKPGSATQRFVAAARGQFSGQISVLFAANSRGITPGAPAELWLDDGIYAGRSLYSTYFEAGIASCGPLWRGGLVGVSNLPLPCGLYIFSTETEESGEGAPEPLFGADCSAALPLCHDLTAGTRAATRLATTRLVNTSYSRTWAGCRYAPAVAGAQERYRGNGAPRSLNVGFEYRILIRPEAGLPIDESLVVGFYVLRNPCGSSFSYAKESASAQDGAGTLHAAYTDVKSDLDAGGVSSATVELYEAPVFSNDLTVSREGRVIVSHTPGAITVAHVGQWLEFTNAAGARKDIACITDVVSESEGMSSIRYEGDLKAAPIVGSDKVHWLTTPAARYRRIAVEFSGGEAAGWRGLSVKVAPGAPGLGADIQGVHFRNPDRPGVITGQASRSGCGFAYQQARYFHTRSPLLQTSPFQEMVSLIDPDVVICSTANQGDTLCCADYARAKIREFTARWTAAKASIEPILYSTGPEFRNEAALDYSEDDKVSYHVVYRQAAQDLMIPHLSVYYDLIGGTGSMNSYLTGENTESRTHPATSFDVRRIVSQLELLLQPECIGDFNVDGGVDGNDVEAFITAWEAGVPRADTNKDGAVDGSDVGAFFSAWESGC